MVGERRSYDAEVAVLASRVSQLEQRCDKKEAKLEALTAFQNRAIGYAMAASAIGTFLAEYVTR